MTWKPHDLALYPLYDQVGWQIWKCDFAKCKPPDWCSVAVSAAVGCIAGLIFPAAPPTTMTELKLLLQKMGASGAAKFLGKLPC